MDTKNKNIRIPPIRVYKKSQNICQCNIVKLVTPSAGWQADTQVKYEYYLDLAETLL